MPRGGQDAKGLFQAPLCSMRSSRTCLTRFGGRTASGRGREQPYHALPWLVICFSEFPRNPKAWWCLYICVGTLGGLFSLLSISPQLALLIVGPLSTHRFRPLSGHSEATEEPQSTACYPSLYPQLTGPQGADRALLFSQCRC